VQCDGEIARAVELAEAKEVSLADTSQIVYGFRLLQSTELRPLLTALFESVVEQRVWRPLQGDHVTEYLNSSVEDDFAREATDITSTRMRLGSAVSWLRTKITA
jgi:hypothetical protein